MLSGLILEDNRTKRAMMTDKVEEMANKRQMHSPLQLQPTGFLRMSSGYNSETLSNIPNPGVAK